jgi:uncharacterized membrane protein HdeD (DUF308 family)
MEWMDHSLHELWWAFLLRAMAALIYGAYTLIAPEVMLLHALFLFAIFAVVDGAASVALALLAKNRGVPMSLLFTGISGFLAAILTLTMATRGSYFFTIIIALWCITRGLFDFLAALGLRNMLVKEWLLALSAVISTFFGFLLINWPTKALASTVWLSGAYATIAGLLLLALALRLKKIAH